MPVFYYDVLIFNKNGDPTNKEVDNKGINVTQGRLILDTEHEDYKHEIHGLKYFMKPIWGGVIKKPFLLVIDHYLGNPRLPPDPVFPVFGLSG